MNRRFAVSLLFLAAGLATFSLLLVRDTAQACPFCSAVSLTFAQEIKAADVVVIANLVERPPTAPGSDGGFAPGLSDLVPKSKFKIVSVLKGPDALKKVKQIESIYLGEAPIGTQFLITGIDPKTPSWATPIELTDRSREYIDKLPKLPEKGPDRLVFFQNYLEDDEDMLKRDAFDEFAQAPYEDVKAYGPRAHYDQLIKWLNDPNISPSHRRLYFTLLGVCGSEKDIPMLEKMFHSNDRKMKAGLDAMIGSYLALKGPSGLTLVSETYMKDPKVEFTDSYAAIQAVRMAQEAGIIEKDKAAKAFHFILDNPKMADLVIPDLARWQDWGVMDRLVSLYVTADAESAYVRAPVLRYLQICPLPEAKKEFNRLAELDPTAAKQAQSFMLPGGAAMAPAPAEKPADKPADKAAPKDSAKDGAKSTGGAGKK